MQQSESRYKRIAQFLLLLYFAETTVDGTGRILDFGFISIRMLLFTLAFVASLPLVIRDFKRIISNPCVIAVLVFAVFAAFSAVVGFYQGNKLPNIRSDITSLLGLALLPGTLAVLDDTKSLKNTMDALFWIASIFSAIVAVLYCFGPVIGWDRISVLNAAYSAGLSVDRINSVLAYFRVNALMIVFSVYGVFKLKESDGNKFLLYLAEAAQLFLILLSTERSSCLGLLVALLIVLAIRPGDIRHYLLSGLITTAIICAFIGLASVTRGELALLPSLFGKFAATEIGNSYSYDDYAADNLRFAVESTPERIPAQPMLLASVEKPSAMAENPDAALAAALDDPEYPIERAFVQRSIGSDNLRKFLIQRHEYYIKKYFLPGAGLGFDMNITDATKSEYMYLDFFMKLGIIGFLSFLAAFFTPVVMCLKRIHCELRTPNAELIPGTRHLMPETLCLLAGYLGMAATSYFEPYLTNPMGIMVLCLLSAAVTIEQNPASKNRP